MLNMFNVDFDETLKGKRRKDRLSLVSTPKKSLFPLKEKNKRIQIKNCQLKETHFQAEGKGSSRLWGKALDLLLFASLPHTFFTILPLQNKFQKQIVDRY